MTAHDATSRLGSGVTATRPPLELTAGAVRAVFVWERDRWSHGVTVAPAGRPAAGVISTSSCAWRSLDGPWPADDDPRWPASPALVELSRVDRPQGGSAILGVGMAGRSHYSASIVRDPRDADAVRFEIACRVNDGPGWLGSTYREGQRLVRIEATFAAGPLPRTVVWAYSVGPQGIFGVEGATVSTSSE